MNINLISQTLKHNALRISAVVSLIFICAITLLLFASPTQAENAKRETVPTSTTTTSTSTTTTTLPVTTTTKKYVPPATTIPTSQPQVNNDGAAHDVWYYLRQCESGSAGLYLANTGNGYYGAYQFSKSTWDSWKTGYEYAYLAPPEVQDATAVLNQQRGGWGQWPHCSKVALRQAGM